MRTESEGRDLNPQDVVRFWFDELTPEQWFKQDDEVDAMIAARFKPAVEQAAASELDDWADTPEGTLGLLILLDQFTRNIYRDSAQAFAQDAKARAITKAALARGFDQKLPMKCRMFVYLPLEHSEDLADQDLCVALCEAMGNENYLDYAKRHRVVIARFGRFPHRNAVLGREPTQEERDYLEGRDTPF